MLFFSKLGTPLLNIYIAIKKKENTHLYNVVPMLSTGNMYFLEMTMKCTSDTSYFHLFSFLQIPQTE